MKLKNIFNGLAAAALALFTVVSCQEPIETTDTLSVDPSKALNFVAKDAEEVTLNVTSNVAWEFTAPEWIKATKSNTKLLLKAEDNTTTEERMGRVVITAGNATPVKINVMQEAGQEGGGENPGPTDGPKATLVAETSANYYLDAQFKTTLKVKMTVEEPAAAAIEAKLALDPDYLEEYEFITSNDYELFPQEGVALDGAVLKIEAGKKESNEVEIALTGNDSMLNGIGYLVPIVAQPVSNVSFTKETKRANFVVLRTNTREIKNVLYFEVNDVNPLNALEYVLEDGTPFYDAVILFAANINYDKINDVVYLHNNPNVQALLDESDVYLQPLRKAGIKVYLGLLGNHDAAGLCQLSDWGAQEWSKEVALACKEYKLDGVNLDDEYSSGPIPGNKWFTGTSSAAGSRLCYELKKALKKECYWPTEVSYFAWGSLYRCSAVKDLETEQMVQPEEFIDFYVANYGGNSSPYAGLTMKQCSAMSIELNHGWQDVGVEQAQAWKEAGYGWVMWFAFNPCPGSHTENRSYSVRLMNNAAKGLYGQSLKPEQNYYKKIGEGEYDPKAYPFE